MPRAAAVSIIAITMATVPAIAQQRQRLSMDPGWHFSLGDVAGAEAASFDDRAWRTLDLPHDWSIEGAVDEQAPGGGRVGYFPTGVGWYRKAFRLPEGARGRRAWLESFNGKGMTVVRAARPGKVRVTASADGLQSATAQITVRPGAPLPTVPAAPENR